MVYSNILLVFDINRVIISNIIINIIARLTLQLHRVHGLLKVGSHYFWVFVIQVGFCWADPDVTAVQ